MNRRTTPVLTAACALLACSVACRAANDAATTAVTASTTATIAAAFEVTTVSRLAKSREFPDAEIDSPAIWRGPDGKALVFVTSKKTDTVEVCDATSATHLRTLGKTGGGLGEFRRPNGAAVFKDTLFIVERDNHRVQAFTLPELKSVAIFGADKLRKPYGIAVAEGEDEEFNLFVTDNHEAATTGSAGLAERVKHFQVTVEDGKPKASLVNSFGDATGPGALSVVESITADPREQLLYICDEKDRAVKLYAFDGRFTGKVFGKGFINNDPEGVVIARPNGPGGGAWLVLADQGMDRTVFHVFEAGQGGYIGAFTGVPKIANTDGIALAQGDLGPFRGGAFYAVNDDLFLDAYSWADIEKALAGR